MTYGVQIFSPVGSLWMDSNTTTWNLVEVFAVAAGAAVTRTYPELNGRSFLVVQIPLEVPKVEDYTYEKTTSVSGYTVTVSGGNQAASILVLAR